MSKYSVKLNQEQRKSLEEMVSSGSAPAREIMHAHILLKSDQGNWGPRWHDHRIQEAFGVGETLIKRVRKRCVEQGMEAALHRRQQPARPHKQKLDGQQEAHVIAMLCTEQPQGQARWTLRAIADRLVEVDLVEDISHETVRTVLKRNALKPWQHQQWCIGPSGDSSFVYHMEDILEVYVQPYDPARPQVCLDEGSTQLLGDKQDELPMQPGKPRRQDYEYTREGFCSVFLACEPLTGTTVTRVSKRRTKADFAHFLKYVLDEVYPQAEKVVLVMDNLNTHTPGSLYAVFPPEEALRLTKKLEIHYTPLHGSWLNMAEIELSILGRQVLRERIADLPTLQARVEAWQAHRNAHPVSIDWRFTTQDARIKLKRLYPILAPCESLEKGSNEG